MNMLLPFFVMYFLIIAILAVGVIIRPHTRLSTDLR